MSETLTKADLQQAVTDVGRHFNESIGTVKQDIGTLRQEMKNRFEKIDKRFDTVDETLVEIDDDVRLLKRAVLNLAADAHLHNLVRELRAKGIELDESKIFLS